MPKSKQQKQETVEALVSGLKNAKGVVFANFQGLTVAQTDELRQQTRRAGVQMFAAKKTLVKRALEEFGLPGVTPEMFKGGIATFTGTADEITPAKVVNGFAKTHEVVAIFGGILEGKFIDAAMVKTLAALPNKQELLSKLVRSLNAPISGFATVSAGILRGLLNALNAYREKKTA